MRVALICLFINVIVLQNGKCYITNKQQKEKNCLLEEKKNGTYKMWVFSILANAFVILGLIELEVNVANAFIACFQPMINQSVKTKKEILILHRPSKEITIIII